MVDKAIKPGSDEDLMLHYAGGDLDAFQKLYERHRGGLYRYFLRQGNPSVAEELFQDVWARVIQSRKRYRPKAAFKTWLYTLAHNRLIDYWRREGSRPIETGMMTTRRRPHRILIPGRSDWWTCVTVLNNCCNWCRACLMYSGRPFC